MRPRYIIEPYKHLARLFYIVKLTSIPGDSRHTISHQFINDDDHERLGAEHLSTGFLHLSIKGRK